MNETSKSLSIIAYFLSEYDMKAVMMLGYSNRSQALSEISKIFGKDNNYLKLRRDEFDALPTSSSNRKGWNNRIPVKAVEKMGAYLSKFSFDELYKIVNALINNEKSTLDINNNFLEISSLSETEIENLVNFEDETAAIIHQAKNATRRIYNSDIIEQLKILYKHECQICGCKPLNSNICEAHHIDYFSKSHNNNSSNIIILCPNHHRLIHKYDPIFNSELLQFEFEDGRVEIIKNNCHL